MPRSQGRRQRITGNEIASVAPRIRNRVLSGGSILKQTKKQTNKRVMSLIFLARLVIFVCR